MIINSISGCCDFICNWLEVDQGFPPPIEIPTQGLPSSIGYLANRFGQLWQNPNHPMQAVLNSPSHPLCLFDYQDVIVNPDKYQATSEGVIPFVVENQGVWQFGFNLSEVDALFVSGDWNVDDSFTSRDTWRKLDATVEDALIFALLGNLCLMCSQEEDWDFDEESDAMAEDKLTLLWNHPAWDEFEGFWTNHDRTLIHYSQSWLSVPKRPWPYVKR